MEIYTSKQLITDFWTLLKGHRIALIALSLIRILTIGAGFAITYLFGRIIDFFTTEYTSLHEFYVLVALIALIGSLQVYYRFWAKLRMHMIGSQLKKTTRLKAIDNLIRKNLAWHTQEETGSKIQRINTGSDNLYQLLRFYSNEGITIITSIMTALSLFLFIDLRYALYALIFTAGYLIGEHYFNKKVTRLADEMNLINERVSGKIHETTANLLTVKSLGLRTNINKLLERQEEEYYRAWYNSKRTSQSKSKTVKIWGALGYAGFILMAGLDIQNGLLTIGSLAMLVGYFKQLQSPLYDITDKLGDYISLKSGIGRFIPYLNLEDDLDGHQELTDWHTIQFTNVGFRYQDNVVLTNFNLTIRKGEKLGIIGRSGEGKSTLIKLLLNLITPTEGRILIDGNDLRTYTNESIIREFSVVLQDSELFNLSFQDNITISDPQLDERRCERVIAAMQLQPLLKRLPQGLATLIGEKGYKISGGERQRIGLARALYKDSSLLLLDEATSSLDAKTEKKILQALDAEHKTLIAIAHRTTTLKNMDRIIRLEHGQAKVVAYGSL